MHKKRVFLIGFLIILLGAINVSADTIPGGDVSGTWYQVNSPYYITGNITVPADSILYMEPGVEVIFQDYYHMTVNGILYAIGTAADSIHFKSGIAMMVISFDNAPDSSHLEYCTLEAVQAALGLIYCSYSNPVITRCRISDNSTSFDAAGGISLFNFSSPNISYCTISGNDGSKGGGIGCGNGCAPFISFCNITGNKNSMNYSIGGAGINVYSGGHPVISNCTFTNNKAFSGSAVAVGEGGSCTITDCIIDADSTFNYTGAKGGGIYFASSNGDLIIANSTIKNCYSYYGGSGIYIQSADSVSVKGCVFDANYGGEPGGTIHSETCSNLVIDHCDLVKNSCWLGGSGIILNGNTNLTLTNSIFRSQTDWNINFWNYSSASVSYNNFYDWKMVLEPFGGYPPAGLGTLTQTNANGDSCDVYYNIYIDPLFVDFVNDDYHLQATSPCIDAGNPGSPLDPDSSITDMGAFYYHYLLGDANDDEDLSISDVVYIISYLFKMGPKPVPIQAGDVNCDGNVSLSDIVYLIAHLFKQGPPPCI